MTTQDETKHDWRWFEADPNTVYFFDEEEWRGPQSNADFQNHVTLQGPRAKERARLMASAPKLLAALEALIRTHVDSSDIEIASGYEELRRRVEQSEQDARAALKEARGEV